MARISAFESHLGRYERWFAEHPCAYHSELLAVRALLPWQGRGLEIGVGTGRFAQPLGVSIGIDASPSMLPYAARRGIHCAQAVAERLPFPDASFDYVLVVTTLCFVDDPTPMLSETWRILEPRGSLCVGFIDRDSPLGQTYLAQQPRSPFYQEATFHSAAEVWLLLERAGFSDLTSIQTLFSAQKEAPEIEPFRAGSGTGAFVVVRAEKDPSARPSSR